MPADTGPQQRKPRGLGRRFQPGTSGNPNGRKPGARNRVSALAQKLMDEHSEEVIMALIKAAKAGDTTAIKLVLDRTAPLPRNRPVCLDMPAIDTPADLGTATNAILRAVAGGELSPDEAASVAGLIETRRRTLEALELEQRITALEQRKEMGR